MRRTLVENSKDSDRRRNVFDIVADLGFLDRKPLPRAEPPPPAALTLLKPLLLPPPQPLDTLTEAQQRAAEQRIAAERLLQEAIELEDRLADEAAKARAANDEALCRELAAALDDMRAAEDELAERAGACCTNVEQATARRVQAEAVFKDAVTVEETARAEAAAAADVVTAHRAAREEMEGRLRESRDRAAAVPAGAATRMAERRAADTAKRIAERQAADAQRGAAS
jgi:hypothetical protein